MVKLIVAIAVAVAFIATGLTYYPSKADAQVLILSKKEEVKDVKKEELKKKEAKEKEEYPEKVTPEKEKVEEEKEEKTEEE